VYHNFGGFEDIDERLIFDWDFGDGQLDSVSNPGDGVVRYTRPAIYNVTCLIRSVKSPRIVTLSQNVTVTLPTIEMDLECDEIVTQNSEYNCTMIINQGLPIEIDIGFGDGDIQSYTRITTSPLSVYHRLGFHGRNSGVARYCPSRILH